jgi:hypothetical protein
MSRGPGRIERAIRALFDEHPDEAFTVDDLCLACYPGLRRASQPWVPGEPPPRWIERKHRVAVWRAAHNVLKDDPDWATSPAALDRRRLGIGNRASVPSVIARRELYSFKREERIREVLAAGPPRPDDAVRAVRDHVTLRDADPIERERLLAERKARGQAELAALAREIRSALTGAKVLSTANGYRSATLTALAARVRALMVENDPDAVRSGLAEVAQALDGIAAG